jgi:hypothetical protein
VSDSIYYVVVVLRGESVGVPVEAEFGLFEGLEDDTKELDGSVGLADVSLELSVIGELEGV